MTKEVFKKIILDFKDWQVPVGLIERELTVDLNMPIKRAVVILGPRRSGKTYFMYSLIKKLINEGAVKERILYVDFEDPLLTNMGSLDLIKLVGTFYEIFPSNRKQPVWIFFDEIQNVSGWEIAVRKMVDTENAHIFITGSSSKVLSKEIATSLRGRTLCYPILPFSFSEYLKIKHIEYSSMLSTGQEAYVANALNDYFAYGGYPEVILYPRERRRITQEIIDVTIYRDIIERHNIRNTKVIRLMFNYLAKAKEFSIHKFHRFLKSLNIKVSKNSLYNYLEYFNDAFIFFPLRKVSLSVKDKEQSIPKIYVDDNAIIEHFAGNDMGKKLENIVFLSLLQRGFQLNKDFGYYAVNGGEIDFIIIKNKKVQSLIQCCYDVSDYITKEREVKSLIKASRKLSCNSMSVITYDYTKNEKHGGKSISFISLADWLLKKPGPIPIL